MEFQDSHLFTNSRLVKAAQRFAFKKHQEFAKSKEQERYMMIHLPFVVEVGMKFMHLIPTGAESIILSSLYLHDTIEDCDVTEEELKERFGSFVARIVKAVSTEGKNRAEKFSDKYFQGIRETPYALFVKLCDRIANVGYSLRDPNKRMLKMYLEEHKRFKDQLYNDYYKEMFDILDETFKNYLLDQESQHRGSSLPV